jgi:exopolyphosphatase / guanosine-5'-triphosphate,3'-diphosphate pyrophosphatase
MNRSKSKIVRRPGPLAKMQGGPVLACIDMGTNSFHMIVCRATPERDHFDVITRAKEAVPFFRRCLAAHYIDEAALKSAVRIIREMQKNAVSRGATSIIAVATSAVRESKNGRDVLEQVREDLQIDARLISGKEEARLIYLGVLWSMPELQGNFTIIDIGGGSTEIISCDRERVHFSESYKLGAARLTQRFFRKGTVSQELIADLHNEVKGMMQPAASNNGSLTKNRQLIGTSGTIQALARLDRHLLGKSTVEAHGWKIPIERLEKIVADIELASVIGEKVKSVSSDRAQTILSGAIVLLETMRCFEADTITVCSAALREGVVVDRFLQSGWLTGSLESHKDPRSASVHDLLERYHGSLPHHTQVARLATEVFLQTQNVVHNYPREVGHLLWAAAMLHDIGMFVGRNGHHKHSYYLIKHSGLLGYSEEEVEMVASIARYHRGSEPKDSHESYQALSPAKLKIVKEMAAILRVAEALDRSHKQVITGINFSLDSHDALENSIPEAKFELVVPLGENCDAEVWAFHEKKKFFEEQFKLFANCEVRAGFAYAVN